MINSQKYDVSYSDFLLKIVKEHGIQNPEDYVQENFYIEEYQLN